MQRPCLPVLVIAVTAASFADCQQQQAPKSVTNGIGMKFVRIAPGTFAMGSPANEAERLETEVQHKVTLTKAFYMGVTTVTQEQWLAVMDNNPSEFKGDKLPVEQVSWDDCQAFLKRLREKDKKPYRLPTEAEWEYACRAGTTTPFHFGATIAAEQANYDANSIYGSGKKGLYRMKTSEVGIFPANAWGLHEMHGNVWQWCQDWQGDYPRDAVTDPEGPKTGKNRIQRGGSWGYHPRVCRSAYRNWVEPGARDFQVGFRVCFTAAD